MEAIRIEHLSRRYGKRLAVEDLCFSVEEGELLALLGLNGAGKSTTVRMLSGLCRPTAGDAYLLGKSVVRESDAVKRFLGMSPQESATAPKLSVRENLELIAHLYGFYGAECKRRVRRVAEVFHLDEVMKQRSQTLSGGWQRRLSIAMALVGEPKILFLDEPTLGLDVLSRRELWSFIEGLKGKMTVILTTHYLEEAEALADRVAVMANGRLCAMGSVKELCAQTETASLEEAFVRLAGGEGRV